ncbi:MAG TPA: DUF975 family protein [Oscillospiraceae bacterium]|nr:DUF975 family protein [Oscillospiraceae bacterium]
MWDRAIIKANAKAALRGRFWVAFAVVLTVAVLPNVLSYWASPKYSDYYRELLNGHYPDSSWIAPYSLLSTLVNIFILIPLIIGMMRFFVQNRFGHTQYDNVFSGFRQGYGSSVLTTFVTYLFIALWSLLLIVPGIIKALQYSMVPFILSDNPNIDGSRARQISRTMTDGEKGAIFVLGLSFIGWALIPSIVGSIFDYFNPLLGMIISSVGMLFLYPYITATFTELYVFLRDRAIQSGMVHPAELNLLPPQEQQPQM